MKRAVVIATVIILALVFLTPTASFAHDNLWLGLGLGILAAPLFWGAPYYGVYGPHYYYPPAHNYPPAYYSPPPYYYDNGYYPYRPHHQRVWIPGHWQRYDGHRMWMEGHWELYPY